jgi:hypothetical protein
VHKNVLKIRLRKWLLHSTRGRKEGEREEVEFDDAVFTFDYVFRINALETALQTGKQIYILMFPVCFFRCSKQTVTVCMGVYFLSGWNCETTRELKLEDLSSNPATGNDLQEEGS